LNNLVTHNFLERDSALSQQCARIEASLRGQGGIATMLLQQLETTQTDYAREIIGLADASGVDIFLDFTGAAALKAKALQDAQQRFLDRMEEQSKQAQTAAAPYDQERLWESEASRLGAERCLAFIETNAGTQLSLTTEGTIACSKALNPKLEFFLRHHRAEVVNLLRNRQPHVY
jgi:hypothetical protein